MKKRILLLDESGIFIRHCLGGQKNLCTTSGYVTGGVFGYVNSVINTANEIRPDHIVCCADSSRQTLERKTIFPLYKENRNKRSLEIPNYKWQKASIKTFADVFCIERVLIEGFEADDVIASAAHQYSKKGYEVYILSGDK